MEKRKGRGMEKRKEMVKGRGKVKGRGMLKGRGMEKRRGTVKGRGMVKGNGEGKGDGEGKGLPGPSSPFVGGPGPSSLSSHMCVPVVLSLGHVTSSLLSCVWLCPCPPGCIVVLSWSHRCAVTLSLPSHVIVVPCGWSIVVLCLSKVGWKEWGMGGTHHGVLTMMTNNIVIHHLVATSPSVMWHLDPVSEK